MTLFWSGFMLKLKLTKILPWYSMCVCVCVCVCVWRRRAWKENKDELRLKTFPGFPWTRLDPTFLFILFLCFYITHDQNELSFTKKKRFSLN